LNKSTKHFVKLYQLLNCKSQEQILVLNHPVSFHSELEGMKSFTTIKTDRRGVKSIDFVIVFAIKQKEIDIAVKAITSLLTEDATLWFCYPKKSSKKYKCEFDRDSGWDVLGTHGYEGVRMVAIDKDWSALRFRHVSKIKKITRSRKMALTEEAKRRTTNKN